MLGELGFFFIFGLAVGSFLTVIVERYDAEESFIIGRSKCNHCRKTLSWWELLPVLGYLLVRGKCIKCDKRIPIVYPLFELITGLSFVGIRLTQSSPVNYLLIAINLLAVSALLILCFYDWLHQSFPVPVLYLALGVVILAVAAEIMVGKVPSLVINDPAFHWLATPAESWQTYLWGALVGAGFLGVLAFPTQGRWMGYGDVALVAILGLWIGYPSVIVGLMLAFYSGAAIGIALLLTHRVGKDHRIAFGPFLILGAVAAKVWAEPMFHAIIRLWGIT